MLEVYQNLPSLIDPVVFSIGSFSIRWYSIMYIVAFFVVYVLLYWRARKGEAISFWKDALGDKILNLVTFSFFGIIIGARLGYVFFYDLDYFLNNSIEIISPVNLSGEFVGLYGMSYHGGFLGFVLSLFFYSKKNKLIFWSLSDFMAPAIAAGYFFGRIGNFLNHELYGRVTQKAWGMMFNDGFLRHPSQLYEAFFEGLILFVILWKLRNHWKENSGVLSGIYVLGYGLIRFFVEFFREPDEHLGLIFGFFSMGQILSLLMVFFGIAFFFLRRNKS